jgi:uncharacterized protein (TIGR02466 family)
MAAPDVLRLFSVPVYSLLLGDFSAHGTGILGAILAERAKGPGIRASNQHAWHSSRALHRIEHPDIGWMVDAIQRFAVAALTESYAGFEQVELRLSACWATVCGPGGWLAPHQHFPAAWSGVLYVAAEPDPSVSEAHDKSGKLELLNPIPLAESFGQPSGVTLTPKNGVALLFPGALSHLVHPSRSARERVSVSFNFDVTPR